VFRQKSVQRRSIFSSALFFPIESLQKAAAARANIGQAYAPAVKLINQTHNVKEKLTIQDDRSLTRSRQVKLPLKSKTPIYTPRVSSRCSAPVNDETLFVSTM
jgi:hypothetical protein